MMKTPATLFALMAAGAATAQTYHFSEVPTGLSLFNGPAIFSVTDKGSYLVYLSSITGPGSAFIFNGRSLTSIPLNKGDFILAMNTPGNLLGSGNNGPFLQDPSGKQTMLVPPEGKFFFVANLNNKEVVVGALGGAGTSSQSGFYWKVGVTTTYEYPGASTTAFNGANDKGDAVGNFYLPTSITQFGFWVDKTGKATLLSDPSFTTLVPEAINNLGLIVGLALNHADNNYAAGWYKSAKGKVTSFDFGDSGPVALPGPKGPLTVQRSLGYTVAWAVNSQGWIGGQYQGTFQDGAGGYVVSIPFVGKPGG
jgi:hypothetical protein